MAEPAAASVAPSVLRGSLRLGLRVVRRFRDNGGLVLANAIAYDGLLSFVPLLLLATALFAHLVDRERFLQVIRAEVLAIVPPRTARPFIDALTGLLEAPSATSALSLATLLFFSMQAFRTLQRALAVTFRHRHEVHRPRTMLASLGIAVAYVFAIGVVSALQALALVGMESVPWLAHRVPSSLHFFATIGLAVLISSFYLVMPVGRGNTRAALISGGLAAVTWRGVQVCLVLYLRYVARINVIYGSLSALVVVLLSFEIAAVIVLLGAQLAAELEQSWEAGRAFWDDGA